MPFEKYAAAAQSLVRPASAARALQNGAPNIERADKLVQLIARQKGLSHPAIDAQVALVDAAARGQPEEGGGVTPSRAAFSRPADAPDEQIGGSDHCQRCGGDSARPDCCAGVHWTAVSGRLAVS